MKTIFCLFRNFDDARQAVQQLMDQHIHQNRVNTLILEQVAKKIIDINPAQLYARPAIPVTGDGPSTLDVLLSRKQPVTLTGVGKIFATGELAGMLTKTAAALPYRSTKNGLEGALADFGLPESTAHEYVQGIRGGGLLLFLRTEDEQAAQVAQLLKQQEGTRHIAQTG